MIHNTETNILCDPKNITYVYKYNKPLISARGFLEISAGLSMSNRGAVVRLLVGNPAGRNPADIFIKILKHNCYA